MANEFLRRNKTLKGPYIFPYTYELDINSRGWYLWTSLAISKEEAEAGTTRTIVLPGGEQVSIPIPARPFDRYMYATQEIRLETKKRIKPPRPSSRLQFISAEIVVTTRIDLPSNDLVSEPSLSPLVFYSGPWWGVQATLAISSEEAMTGTTCIIILPNGHQVSLSISPGASDGQIIRLAEFIGVDNPRSGLYTLSLIIL